MSRALQVGVTEKIQIMAWEMQLIAVYAIRGLQMGDVFPCLKYL